MKKFGSNIPAGVTDYYRDKGGASHSTPGGYVNSGFWSLYANAFAEDGSEDQLIAALTKSVPAQWLAERGISQDDEVADRNWLDPNGPYKHPGVTTKKNVSWDRANFDRSPDNFLDSYTRGLQSRLRNEFKAGKKGMENQGAANLRDQAQDALTGDLKTIDADANSRGILFSGKRQAAHSAAAGQRAGELGQATTDYMQSIGDMERGLNSDVFGSELDSSLRQADINDLVSGSFYNKMRRNASDSQLQSQAAQNFGSGVGSLTGALTSRMKKKQGTTLS